jgi:PAS domain S-box-containing protein
MNADDIDQCLSKAVPLKEATEATGKIAALQLELERSRRELDQCQRRWAQLDGLFAHVVDAIFVVECDGRIIDANPAASELLGYSKEEFLTMCPWDFVTSVPRVEILATIEKLKSGAPSLVQRVCRSKNGETKIVSLRMRRDGFCGRDLIVVTGRDVTAEHQARLDLEKALAERKQSEALLQSEKKLTEMIARGDSLEEILNASCRLAEEAFEGSLAIVMLLDPKDKRLRRGAAPSLAEFMAAVDGFEIGPVGTCAAAAFRKEQVITHDIATDPHWAECRELASRYGLGAGWATPVFSSSKNILGTFALYWPEPRSPTQRHLQIIDQIARLVAIAIERKRSEEEMLRNEAFLAEGQRLSKTGSYGWKVSTGELYWSEETYRIYQYDPTMKPIIPMVYQRVHPEDLHLMEETCKRASQEGKDYQHKFRAVMPDGSLKHIHIVAHSLRDKSGNLEYVGAVMDVTEQKQSQDTIRAAKARFEGILEIAEDAIISVDGNQRIVLFNQGAEKVFGYTQAEAIGNSLELLLPQRFALEHREHIREFAQSPDIARIMGQRREVFGVRKDGHEFPAEASISKLDLGGELVFTVILRDITERKRSSEALLASELLARGQVNALTRTVESMAQESVPDALVGHVLQTITDELHAHSASVWRRDEMNGLVNFEVAFEGGNLVTKSDASIVAVKPYMPIHEFWPRHEDFLAGKPSLLEDIRLVPTFPWRDHLLAQGIIAVFCVPMLIAGQVEGVTGIRFTHQRTFRAEEVELAKALANQAMLALELTRLSAQSRQAAVMAERNRVARDIHDTLAQGFTGVIMQLEAAKGAVANGEIFEIKKRIEQAVGLARSSLGEARRSVRALRPRSLRDGTLSTALAALLKRMANGIELNAQFQVEGNQGAIPVEWEEGLLRIVQESLTNTIKHARARNFAATLSVAAKRVELELVDDGRGFDPWAENDGFGLVGMKERAEQMGGQFVLYSKPGEGTRIQIVLSMPHPIKPAAEMLST